MKTRCFFLAIAMFSLAVSSADAQIVSGVMGVTGGEMY